MLGLDGHTSWLSQSPHAPLPHPLPWQLLDDGSHKRCTTRRWRPAPRTSHLTREPWSPHQGGFHWLCTSLKVPVCWEWRPMETSAWRPMANSVDRRRHMETCEDQWSLMEIHGDPWRPVETSGDSQRLMENCEDQWSLMEIHGVSWRPLEIRGDQWTHED